MTIISVHPFSALHDFGTQQLTVTLTWNTLQRINLRLEDVFVVPVPSCISNEPRPRLAQHRTSSPLSSSVCTSKYMHFLHCYNPIRLQSHGCYRHIPSRTNRCDRVPYSCRTRSALREEETKNAGRSCIICGARNNGSARVPPTPSSEWNTPLLIILLFLLCSRREVDSPVYLLTGNGPSLTYRADILTENHRVVSSNTPQAVFS